MPKINVYLPDALASAVKDAGVPVSAVCQVALSEAVDQIKRTRMAIAALRDPATPLATVRLISEVSQNRMTARLIAVFQAAATEPTGPARAAVSSLDLLQALLDEGENLAVRLMISQGADVDALATATAAATGSGAGETPPAVPGPDADLLERLTMPARLACAAALEAALELGHNYVGCEHLLIGLTVSDGRASELLASQGIVAASLRQALSGALAGIVHERSRPAGPSAGALADVVRRLEAIERQLAGSVQP
jgi:ATP-dependent Clp protease ATP-binding subunit ClpA